ncbi:hypothetical protein B0H14DRAFT_2637374 [Mycena olivaceomarginata]|nr:hypothetical protein B0H14DRAFT_2637374 [Mycena olivaceomarginata]
MANIFASKATALRPQAVPFFLDNSIGVYFQQLPSWSLRTSKSCYAKLVPHERYTRLEPSWNSELIYLYRIEATRSFVRMLKVITSTPWFLQFDAAFASTRRKYYKKVREAQEQHERQAGPLPEKSGKPGTARENTFPLPRYKNIGGVSEEPREARVSAKPQIVKDYVRTRPSLAEFGITESPWLRATESTGYALVEILVSEIFPRSHLRRNLNASDATIRTLFRAEVFLYGAPFSAQTFKPLPSRVVRTLSTLQMHSNLEEAHKSSFSSGLPNGLCRVQPVPLMHSIIEEDRSALVETADISVDVLTDNPGRRGKPTRRRHNTIEDIRAAWKLTEETNKLLHGTAGTTRNFKVKRRRPLTPSYNYYFSYN